MASDVVVLTDAGVTVGVTHLFAAGLTAVAFTGYAQVTVSAQVGNLAGALAGVIAAAAAAAVLVTVAVHAATG